jgi:hypothetical protein
MIARSSTILGTTLAGIAIAILTGFTKGEDAPGGEMASVKLDSTMLLIHAPVNVDGPIPKFVREIEEGDVIQLQVAYPVKPPCPVEAAVKSTSRALSVLFVTSNENEIAFLGTKPKQRRDASSRNYFSAYLRANNASPMAEVSVTATYPDNTKKEITLSFKINPRGSDPTSRYYNPPNEVPKIGRILDPGTYPELFGQLRPGEVLIATFTAANEAATLAASEVPSRKRLDQILRGRGVGPLNFYAVPAEKAEQGFASP